MRRRFLKIHQILHLFAPYRAPIGASPLSYANLNPHSQKMLPTKFGWKSVQWFWRRSYLKEKFTPDDRRRTGSDHYSSLEPSAQVF